MCVFYLLFGQVALVYQLKYSIVTNLVINIYVSAYFCVKLTITSYHVIPYNLVSLKSNPPKLHSIAARSRLWSKAHDAKDI